MENTRPGPLLAAGPHGDVFLSTPQLNLRGRRQRDCTGHLSLRCVQLAAPAENRGSGEASHHRCYQATPAASPFALMSFPVTENVTAFPAGPPGSNPVSLPQSFCLESSMTAQIPAQLYVSLSVRTPQPHNPRRVKHHCVQTRTSAPSGMTVLPFSGTAEAGWDPKLRTCASVYISALVVCIADRYGE